MADMTRMMLPTNVDLSFLSNRQLSSTGLIYASALEPCMPNEGGPKLKRGGTMRPFRHHQSAHHPDSSSTEEEIEMRRRHRGSAASVTSVCSRASVTTLANLTSKPHTNGSAGLTTTAMLADRTWLPEDRLATIFSQPHHAGQEEDAQAPPSARRLTSVDGGWGWAEGEPALALAQNASTTQTRLVCDDLALRLELHTAAEAHSSAYTHQIVHGGIGTSQGGGSGSESESEEEPTASDRVYTVTTQRGRKQRHETVLESIV
jgi:hypothetical protein